MKYILWNWWVPFSVGATLILGVVYVAVQQSYRQNANDPQISIAEDLATNLNRGGDWQTLIPSQTVAIESSLSPFVEIYDENGNVLGGNGELNRQPPMLPSGVFNYAKQHGVDRVTWQPEPGVRSALVVVPFRGPKQAGYVASGRSLREVEVRIVDLSIMIGAAWVAVIAGTLIAGVLSDRG